MQKIKRILYLIVILVGLVFAFNSCHPHVYGGIDINAPTMHVGPFSVEPHMNVGGPIR
ncbi:MAG: hypothetical protein ABFR62_04540 [Bacteroidota bacterium]